MQFFFKRKRVIHAPVWETLLVVSLLVWPQTIISRAGASLKAFAEIRTIKEVETRQLVHQATDKGWELWTTLQKFSYENCASVVTVFVLVITAFIIWLQIRATVRTRQQAMFTSLVSGLNNIPFYPQNYSPPIMKRMELLGKLHNYLDGVEDILNRERRPLRLSFLKKPPKKITEQEKKRLYRLLEKKKKWFYLRVLRWYKYVQKYYISLHPEEGEILFHLKNLRAIADPHTNEDHFAPMQPFNPRQDSEEEFSKRESNTESN